MKDLPALLTIVAGVITGVLFLYLVNGGITKGVDTFLAQLTAILVLSTCSGANTRGGWPLMNMIKSPMAAGRSRLVTCYVVDFIIFRVFINYGFVQGAPVYDAAMRRSIRTASSNARSAVVYCVTVIGVMFLMLSFDLCVSLRAGLQRTDNRA